MRLAQPTKWATLDRPHSGATCLALLMQKSISGADVRAKKEASVIALLCEICLKKVETKLREGQTLFDSGQDEHGFCQRCSRRINAFSEEKAKEEGVSFEETDSRH